MAIYICFKNRYSQESGYQDGVVGIATRYGMGGPGIEPRRSKQFFLLRKRLDTPWGYSAVDEGAPTPGGKAARVQL